MFLKNNSKIIFLILCLLTHIACSERIIETFTTSLSDDDEEIVEEIDDVPLPKSDSNQPDEPLPHEPLPEEIEADTLGIDYGNSGKPSKSQKGPFYMDSDVFIQEMTIENNDFVYSGNIFIDKVIDDLGSFIFPNKLNSPYVDVRVNGYYFNEITGAPSDSVISLGSYSSLADHKIPNINILTTLAQKRIRNLIKNNQFSFENAETQAKEEVLRIFHIDEEIKNFDELSIEGDSSGDAALLAISLILQGNLNTGQLSNFIAMIREDLSDNGVIDDQAIHDQICEQTRSLDPISIRENLLQFYNSINMEELRIPLFEDYLDSDCDGVINKNDPDSFIFFNIKVRPGLFDEKVNYSIYPFQNQIWIMGADLSNIRYSSKFSILEDFESRDFNYLHSPIMFTLDGNLHLLGGWQGIYNDDWPVFLDAKAINSIGHYMINTELDINEIVSPYFNDFSDDPETNYLEYIEFIDSDNEDIYFHFSADSHEVLNHNDKIYLIKKNNSLPGRRFRSPLRSHPFSKMLTHDLEWESDELTELLDPWSEFILDIISFNDQIYILAKYNTPIEEIVNDEAENIEPMAKHLNQGQPENDQPEEEDSPEFHPEDFRTATNDESADDNLDLPEPDGFGDPDWDAERYRVKLIKYDPLGGLDQLTVENVFTIHTYEYYHYKEQYFTLYEDILIVTNSNTSLMSYSNDGEMWAYIHHPYRIPAEPYSKQNYIYHEPIVFRNMIHLIGGSQNSNPEYNGVVYGYFRNYYDYIRQMNLL